MQLRRDRLLQFTSPSPAKDMERDKPAAEAPGFVGRERQARSFGKIALGSGISATAPDRTGRPATESHGDQRRYLLPSGQARCLVRQGLSRRCPFGND